MAAPKRSATTADGGWVADGGEKLYAPDPAGGWNQRYPNGHGGWLYRLDGHLHRLDGPAVTWRDGTELWYRHGKLHRDDGPAVSGGIHGDEYWLDGVRTDAPASPRHRENPHT